jgi:hypothetical protein
VGNTTVQSFFDKYNVDTCIGKCHSWLNDRSCIPYVDLVGFLESVQPPWMADRYTYLSRIFDDDGLVSKQSACVILEHMGVLECTFGSEVSAVNTIVTSIQAVWRGLVTRRRLQQGARASTLQTVGTRLAWQLHKSSSETTAWQCSNPLEAFDSSRVLLPGAVLDFQFNH